MLDADYKTKSKSFRTGLLTNKRFKKVGGGNIVLR